MSLGLAEFEAVFSQLVEDLRTQCCEEFKLPTELWQWFANVCLRATSRSP